MTATITPADVAETERRVALVLIRELEPPFAHTLSHNAVSSCVVQAVADLRGSVCVEALPEMAARLAHYRLQTAIKERRNATTTLSLVIPA